MEPTNWRPGEFAMTVSAVVALWALILFSCVATWKGIRRGKK